LMDFPCQHTQKCNTLTKTCEFKKCLTKIDCDDHLFCNGEEFCNNHICQQERHYPCSFKTCSEKDVNCIESGIMGKYSDIIKINLNSPPIWDPNDLGVQIGFLIGFIILSVL